MSHPFSHRRPESHAHGPGDLDRQRRCPGRLPPRSSSGVGCRRLALALAGAGSPEARSVRDEGPQGADVVDAKATLALSSSSPPSPPMARWRRSRRRRPTRRSPTPRTRRGSCVAGPRSKSSANDASKLRTVPRTAPKSASKEVTRVTTVGASAASPPRRRGSSPPPRPSYDSSRKARSTRSGVVVSMSSTRFAEALSAFNSAYSRRSSASRTVESARVQDPAPLARDGVEERLFPLLRQRLRQPEPPRDP
mmetsp:Transcript_15278/g.49944  ORF Transcript_15278/g.49944 Transcript_15278/m.49944 type:complete len:251 (-) Transcript_15278:287-1039(-)